MTVARRNVLHIIDTLEHGGAQRLLALFASWVPQEGHRQIVCALQPGDDLRKPLEAAGAKVICLGRARPSILRGIPFFAYVLRSLRDLVAIGRNEQVDVVQCHLSDAELLGILAGRLLGVDRIITTIHSTDFLPSRVSWDPRNLLRVFMTRMLYARGVDRIVAVSEDAAEKVRRRFGVEAEKVQVLLNRIDVDALTGLAPDDALKSLLGIARSDRVLVCVARLVDRKGQAVLLAAFQDLIRGWGALKLGLVGDGDSRELLVQRCRELGLSSHVLFLGSRDDVPALLAMSDVFVLPSLADEGTSLALLEAMACGLPVVATSIPGNAAVIEDGVSGLLVPPGDVQELSRAIDFMLRHPDTARAFGRKARQIVREKYDIRQTVAELQALWS